MWQKMKKWWLLLKYTSVFLISNDSNILLYGTLYQNIFVKYVIEKPAYLMYFYVNHNVYTTIILL